MDEQIDDALAALQDADDVDPVWRATLSAFLPALRNMMQNMPAGEGAGRAFEPVSIETTSVARVSGPPWRKAYNISFPQGLVWGIMGCAAGFGISLVVERTRGTLVRLRMAPISRAQILGGKGLACLITALGVAVLMFAFGRLVFGVTADSYAKLALAIGSVALSFVGIMMFLSVLGKTEQSAGGIGWAILLVLAMIGGGMVPYQFLPDWLKVAGSISPIKWSILAMEGALWRGFSFAEMLRPCGVLLAIGVVCYLVGARAFRWTEQ
jgi:ABC-2 type transport system permease protein